MSGRQRDGDTVLEAPIGALLSDTLRAAVRVSLEWDTPVFFSFNGRGYRATRERLEQFIALPAGEAAGT